MGSTRPTAPTAFPSRRIQDDMAARTVPVSTPRLHVQQNRPAPFTKGGRLVGATCAQTIRKPRLVKRAAAGASAQRRLLAGRGTGCPGERHDIVRAITQRPRRNAAHFETGESMRDYGDDTRGRPRRSQSIFRSRKASRISDRVHCRFRVSDHARVRASVVAATIAGTHNKLIGLCRWPDKPSVFPGSAGDICTAWICGFRRPCCAVHLALLAIPAQ